MATITLSDVNAMIGDFLKKKTHLKKKKKGKSQDLGGEEYIDLTQMEDEGEGNLFDADVLIKIAEIHRFEDIRDITEQVYDGNILMVDIEAIAGNEESMDRVQTELKAVANEVSGDIARIGTNFIAVTPEGIAIDRSKIKPF